MSCKVVSIKRISAIPNADKIELVEMNENSWQCIVGKGTFKVNDLAIYFQIDSIVNIDDNTKFLKNPRIKTIKLKGMISQGLLGSLTWAEPYTDISKLKVNDDITTIMKVKKYVPFEETVTMTPSNLKPFPSYVIKTDAERIQNLNLALLNDLLDMQVNITKKYDGMSATYVYNNGEFKICSRNYHIVSDETGDNIYYKIAKMYDLENKMKKLNLNIAIQGELIGLGSNKNRHKLNTNKLCVFDIYDIDEKVYHIQKMVDYICKQLELEQVETLYDGLFKDFKYVDKNDIVKSLIKYSTSLEYEKNIKCEGFVLKTDGISRIKFKVINPEYLLLHDL